MELWMSQPAASVALRRRVSVRFDGNHTDIPLNWIFADADFEGISKRGLRILAELLSDGDLAWVVFVPVGYRV